MNDKLPAAIPKVLLVAGEPSGDALGAQLVKALRSITNAEIEIVGVGGEAMRAAGIHSLFSIEDTSVMGLREVVPRIPKILKRVRQAAEFARSASPDVAVMIDSPDFTHKVAKKIRQLSPEQKVIDYVAPQVWASRPGRAKKMAAVFDHVLCLLPFEVPFFQKVGLAATFVGHPVVEREPLAGQGESFRNRHNIDAQQKILLLLPGSRKNELRFLWSIFKDAILLAEAAVGSMTIVIPTVQNVAADVRALVKNWGRPIIVVEGAEEKLGAFAAGDVALAASGTVSTELALSATPMVIGYRVGAITAALARPFIKVPYVTLVNLILGRMAIPEFVQEQCTAQNLSKELVNLLSNHSARVAQVTASAQAVNALGRGEESPSYRAARAILKIIEEPHSRQAK